MKKLQITRIYILISFLFLCFISGCNDEIKDETDGIGDPKETENPLNNVKILEGETANAIESVFEDGKEIVFKTDTIQGLDKDKILVVGIGEKTPAGLLRRITSSKIENGGFVLSTEKAYMEDLIKTDTVEFEKEFDFGDLEDCVSLSSDGTFICSAQNQNSRTNASVVEFNKKLSANASVSGELNSEMSLKLESNLGFFDHELNMLDLKAKASITGSLTFTASGSYDADIDVEVGKMSFIPKVAFIGALPVVIKPVVTIYVGASGKTEGGLTVKPSVTAEANENITWDFNNGIKRESPEHKFEPKLSVNARAEAGVELSIKAKVDFLIYNVGGPYIAPEAIFDLSVSVKDDCYAWNADVLLQLNSGISLGQVFSKLAGLSKDFPVVELGKENIFGGAENCPPGFPDPNSSGDVHILTPDGLAFDFQGAGEFIILKSSNGEVEIQARQEPWIESTKVTVNTAVAMNVSGDKVGIYLKKAEPVIVNGLEEKIENYSFLDLPNGGKIYHLASNKYTIVWPNGFIVGVTMYQSHLNFGIANYESINAEFGGILGNLDNNENNEIVSRDGVELQEPVRFEDLYKIFGDSWRISDSESLFDYEAGNSTATYQLLDFPKRPVTVNDLNEDNYTSAMSRCLSAGISDPVLLNNCILDLALTNDNQFIESSINSSFPNTYLKVQYPIYFDNWKVINFNDEKNDWNVNSEGRMVTQLLNGGPGVFISPNKYINYKIQGKFKVNTSYDNDFIGFVIGYQDPVSLSGEDPEIYEFVLFDWKQTNQTIDEGLAEEGMALLKYIGGLPDIANFWPHENGGIEELATDYGNEKGWQDFQEYEFEAIYTENNIKIYINGELIFDVDGDFEEGSFGFYNYSQRSVQYYDFVATEL